MRTAGVIFGLSLVAGLIGVNYMAIQIASPAPSDILSSAKAILDSPEKYGLRIKSISCRDGNVPTLIVEPEPDHPISAKGQLVRTQLEERNVNLTKYGTIKGTVVILHGRNGRKENSIGIAERFCAAGLRCILVDLPSHGASPVENVKFGSTNWEQDLPYEVLKECAQRYHFTTENTALWGMSMGGSFAVAAVADPDHGKIWSSVTIVCSFDSLTPVIKKKCKLNWLTKLTSSLCQLHSGPYFSDVTPAKWAEKTSTPALVIHGDDDELIPSVRGTHLYQNFASKDKKWLTVKAANHNNILITPMPLYAEMTDWILTHFKE